MKKKSYLVGHETTRKGLMIYVVVCVSIFLLGMYLLLFLESGYGFVCLIIACTGFVCSPLEIVPSWRVEENRISIYSASFIQRWKRFFSILFKNQDCSTHHCIEYRDIEKVEVIFNQVPMAPYGSYGYPIYILIKKKDHSEEKLEIYLDDDKKKAYYALDYLKTRVKLEDQWNIISNLLDEHVRLAEYIENVVKTHHLKKYF